MGLAQRLNRPDLLGLLWRPAYEFGYACLRAITALVFGPIFRVHTVGAPPRLPRGGVILCPNHASYLDPAFVQLCLARRVTFVMTNDFYANRWGRWFFQLVGAVPVGRGRLARRGLRRAIALLRRGHAVVVFPEGRLSRDGTMHHAQRGVAIMARRARAPIFPVAIAGSMRAWRRGACRPRRANVRVAFAPRPMRWSGEPGRGAQQAFADAVMRSIEALYAKLLDRAPHPLDNHTLQHPDGEAPPAEADVQRPSQDGR